MRLLRGRRGQIVIPALFIFPSLMLFVYLIYETAKLSREKIRHQFAIDAAAFVEMVNYSDFLNRTAYVNGAFPMRIFNEGFKDTCVPCEGKADCKATPPCSSGKSLWDILHENGAYPRSTDKNVEDYTQVNDKPWDIRFNEENEDSKEKNGRTPELKETIELLSFKDANNFWITWDEANDVYKLYVQVYKLLGSVEEAQYSVLTRLAEGHNFFKKSYWLNTGDPDPNDGATAFHRGVGEWRSSGVVKPYCHKYMLFHGNKATGSAFRPYQIWASYEDKEGEDSKGKDDNGKRGVRLENTISGCEGLFQVMWVNPNTIKNLTGYWPDATVRSRGVPVGQPWTAPSNYFNHDFNTNAFQAGRPSVHVTVSVSGDLSPGRPLASVWPDPTPKFQVRTYP